MTETEVRQSGRVNHGLNVSPQSIKIREHDGTQMLCVVESDSDLEGSIRVGDGTARYPVPGQRRDYETWGTSELKDTIRLRVLGWRHTFQYFCTDDTRPLEFIGVFHPGRFPRTGTRYHTDVIQAHDFDEWVRSVLRSFAYAAPPKFVRHYVRNLASRFERHRARAIDQLDPTVRDAYAERVNDEAVTMFLALTSLPSEIVASEILLTLDEDGIDYLDIATFVP